LAGVSYAKKIYVPDDYAAIQEAINASVEGDTIIVRPETFFESIDFSGKAITLISEKGPEVTIIDGGGLNPVVMCTSSEGPNTVLNGFTITNGQGVFAGG